jgi:hypothetical protein
LSIRPRSSAQHPQHTAQRRLVDCCVDPNPSFAATYGPGRRRDRNRHELQCSPDPSLRLSPPVTKQVRMHIVTPRHRRHDRAGPAPCPSMTSVADDLDLPKP